MVLFLQKTLARRSGLGNYCDQRREPLVDDLDEESLIRNGAGRRVHMIRRSEDERSGSKAELHVPLLPLLFT